MATRDPKEAKIAGLVGTVWVCLMMIGSLSLGILARALSTKMGTPLADPETAAPFLVSNLFHPAVVGLLTVATLAALMSSDSQLLIASTSLVRDLYHKILGRDLSAKTELLYSRIAGLVVVGVRPDYRPSPPPPPRQSTSW
ncbi:MAG: hypothetical protein AB1576_01585 [Bacillota bacterium]